jgi:predicted small secreted protein
MWSMLVAAVALAVAFVAGGCNTIEGAGKDIKATGGAIEKAAEKSKPY